MSERVGGRLEPSLEREGAGGRLKSLLTKKGLGLMEDLMKEGWMVGGKTYEGRLDGWKIVVKKNGFWLPPPLYCISNAYLCC